MKKILVAGAILSLLSLVIVPMALAQTTTSAPATSSPVYSISAGTNGNVTLRGTLKAISGTSLTVTSWGGDWMVDVSSAKLLRRFGAVAGIAEFQTGDQLTVQGKVSTSASWSITATRVQDMSIQAKNADSTGTVSSLNAGARTFSLTTKNKGVVVVTVNGDAKIYLGKNPAQISDLANGQTVRVQGVWDRTASTILASLVRISVPKSTSGSNSTSTGQ